MESEPSRYEAPIDLDNDNDSHVLMIRMVGGGKRVLDVGCWNGDMGSHLARRNIEVIGIEKDESAARVAASRMHRVVVGDVENLDLEGNFGEEAFDVIVLGDVLEHLVEPATALRRIRPLLAPRGYVVASIPNVAHGSVRLNLLRGEFRYTDVGLLDRTHLHFFTRQSLYELFEEAGFAIVELETTTVDPLLAPEGHIEPSATDPDVVERLRADPDAQVYQFVLRAVPDGADHAISELYRRERQLSSDLARLRKTAQGRSHGRRSGLVQLAVVGASEDGPGSWCLSLLQREIERRWPEASVVVLAAAEWSTVPLRWADGVLILGRDDLRGGTADNVVPLDLKSTRLAGMAGDPLQDPPLFGVALHAARSRKDDGGPQRLAMLRLLGAIPSTSGYLVVAAQPGSIVDLEGFTEVVRRVALDGGGIVLLPLSDGPEVGRIGESFASAGMATSTLPAGAPLEDVIAVLGDAGGVVTTDPSVGAMALSMGVPHALLTPDGPTSTLVAAIGGGVAASVTEIEGTLYRTADLSGAVAKLAPVQARVDDVLDAVVGKLAVAPIMEERISDPEYVASLEQAVEALQRRICGERLKLAGAFQQCENESRLEVAGHQNRSADLDARLGALQRAADSYRLALADLQERLWEATRCAPPAPAASRRGVRRIARAVVRRLGVVRR